MQSNLKFSGFVRQTLALTALLSASAVLAGAQTVAPKTLDLQLPAVQTTAAEPEFSSSVVPETATAEPVEVAALTPHVNFMNAMQYGGRRSGRPRYRGGNTTQDGVEKYTFYAGAGMTAPLGDMKKYNTVSYAYQVGVGRNFTRHAAMNVEFDWDNFGLQGTNLANQFNLYNTIITQAGGIPGQDTLSSLDGNTHIWSFSLDPQYTFFQSDSGMGAYVIGGVGYYHKVTTFTTPETGVEEDAFGDIYEVEVNGIVDHYTANSIGVTGGLGLTYKFSRFANERFYLEARYAYVPSSQRYGLTIYSTITPTSINVANDYPANSNKSGYIPIKAGIRF